MPSDGDLKFGLSGRPGPSSRRREFLQVGFSSAVGLSLANVLASQGAAPAQPPAKSVLFIFLTGAASQLDTFDMKPSAPAEIRGEFKPIRTSVPGLLVCEHLPCLAARAKHYAVIRTVTCDRSLAAHDFGVHAVLAGVDHPPAGPTRAASRHDWPTYASGLDYLRPRQDGLPSGVSLPTFLADGTIGPYPGQTAGFLGSGHDPWLVTGDPNRADFEVRSAALPAGFAIERIHERMNLLSDVEIVASGGAKDPSPGALGELRQRAVRLLSSGRLGRAFDLSREHPRLRERYGRHLFGQSLLMARRLVQAGVPIVQVNLGVVSSHWDTHTDNFNTLRDQLLPPCDQSVSALLDDLAGSGLLAETLVVMMGEFGRTPKIGGNLNTPFFSPTGRDHWTDCFFAVFAGAGVQGGQVIGTSDKFGAYPVTSAYTPADIGATIYRALGIDPAAEIIDRLGRPTRLNRGTPIAPLFTGA